MIKRRNIKEDEYDFVISKDKEVYPTSSPVSKQSIQSWFKYHPEFAMFYENEKGDVICFCIVIALTRDGFEKLVNGKMTESEISEKELFNNHQQMKSENSWLGLHIYHLEKLDSSTKGWYKRILNDLSNMIEDLRIKNSNLKVCGFSALCVTVSGISLFYNTLNLREREFINEEHVMEKRDKQSASADVKIVQAQTIQQLAPYIHSGYNYKNRCKMLVTYPNEPSIVWTYIHSKSTLLPI